MYFFFFLNDLYFPADLTVTKKYNLSTAKSRLNKFIWGTVVFCFPRIVVCEPTKFDLFVFLP